MVKAGSLFFVIAISLVIAALSSSLLLLSYYQQNLVIKGNQSRILAINERSGETIVLAWKGSSLNNLDTTIDLYQRRTDSIEIQAHSWGLFTVGTVKAHNAKMIVQHAFLYGPVVSKTDLQALFLADNDGSISISGSTVIRGNASLPAAGIRKGYIEGIKYSQDTLVYGTISKSSRNLPALQQQYLKTYDTLLFSKKKIHLKDQAKLQMIQNLADSNSFFAPTRWIKSNANLDLTNKKLQGNICIYSSVSILIDSTTKLDNVILIAPVILIKGHFSGSLQAFASDSLLAEPYCNFTYPSSLVLIKNPLSKAQPLLKLGDHCRLNGIVLSACKKQDNNQTQMQIGPGCQIQGVIYCNGYLQLSGKVSGTVYTDHFLYRTSSTIYDNYLIDANISRPALNPHFVSSAIFTDAVSNNKRAICLY